MSQPIRLGFIGASASPASWASRAHMPYLQSPQNTSQYSITAIQNSSKASADKAIDFYNLSPQSTSSHGDPTSLANDPAVDMVAVSVNVPDHLAAITPALEAGKDVFVEWPLARTLADAESLTKQAQAKNLATLVGLQARQNPSVVAAKRLVESGALGDVLGSSMHGFGMIFGAQHARLYAYTADVENGANLLTIPFGHAVDALCFVLGEWVDVQATLANVRPEFDLVDDEGNVVERATKTAHDYVSVQGTLVNGGGVVTVVYQGGNNPTGGPGLVWQIDGTKGSVRLEGAMGHLQMFQPTIKVIYSGETEMKDVEGVEWVGDDFSHSVGVAWEAFAAQKKGRTVEKGCVTTFEDALVRHRMIDAIYRSNEKGTREKYL